MNLFTYAIPLSVLLLIQLGPHHSEQAIKVAIVGSGNWGTSAARRIALNLNDSNDMVGHQKYNSTVSMWVYEEMVSVIVIFDDSVITIYVCHQDISLAIKNLYLQRLMGQS